MSDGGEHGFGHLDREGRARMIDVGGKEETARVAVASALVRLDAETRARVAGGDVPKGDVLATARIAGIQAAKRTADLIPLCHPLRLTDVEVGIDPEGEDALAVTATVRARDRTGVEMEALTAAAVASLTVYDMVKGICRGAVVERLRLERKSGGKSGEWTREGA